MSARHLLLAKRRSARRAESAGAVMFIVAMTMAVLAALGMFALRAASYESRTSGYERQNAQTHYLAEYGVLAGAIEINPGTAKTYKDIAIKQGPMRDTKCVSIPSPFTVSGTVSTPSLQSLACKRLGAAELTASWGNSGMNAKGNTTNVHVLDPWTTSAPGSLGSAPINGDWFVEITDPIPMNVQANNSFNNGCGFYEITVTSVGITTPARALAAFAGNQNDTGFFANQGIETQRARFMIGPICNDQAFKQ